MRSLTQTELEFTTGASCAEAFIAGMVLTAISTVFISAILNPSQNGYSAKTCTYQWVPYYKEVRTPLYDAYGYPTGLDDVKTIEDFEWKCV